MGFTDENETTHDKPVPAGVSGLKRSVKPRRFSYPTSSQITKTEKMPTETSGYGRVSTNVVDPATVQIENPNSVSESVLLDTDKINCDDKSAKKIDIAEVCKTQEDSKVLCGIAKERNGLEKPPLKKMKFSDRIAEVPLETTDNTVAPKNVEERNYSSTSCLQFRSEIISKHMELSRKEAGNKRDPKMENKQNSKLVQHCDSGSFADSDSKTIVSVVPIAYAEIDKPDSLPTDKEAGALGLANLFSTASGKSITVSKESLNKASAFVKQVDSNVLLDDFDEAIEMACQEAEQENSVVDGFTVPTKEQQVSAVLSSPCNKVPRGNASVLEKSTVDRNASTHIANTLYESVKVVDHETYNLCWGPSTFTVSHSLATETGEKSLSLLDTDQEDNNIILKDTEDISLLDRDIEMACLEAESNMSSPLCVANRKNSETVNETHRIDHSDVQSSIAFDCISSNRSDIEVQYSLDKDRKADILRSHIKSNRHTGLEDKTITTMRFKGFRTAGGRVVKIDENALERARSFIEKIERSADLGTADENATIIKQNFEDSNRQVQCSSAIKVFRDTLNDRSSHFSELETFDTATVFKNEEELASNQHSTANTEDTKSSVAEFNSDCERNAKLWSQAKARLMELEKEQIEKTPNPSGSFNESISFQGFQSASGKAVTVVEDALLKAKARMLELENQNSRQATFPPKTEVKDNNLQGFSKASGKAVTVSKDDLRNAQVRMLKLQNEATEQTLRKGNTNNGFHDFQTVSEKPVTVSKDALLKAKTRILELEREGSGYATNSSNFMENSFQGFQTASGKAVTISEDSFLNAKARMLELEKEGSGHATNSSKTEFMENSFQGFQTASGKAVTISEGSLLKAKSRMLELEKEVSGHAANSSKGEFKGNSFKGFQTDSGKTVSVSEDTLLKANTRILELEKESSGYAINSSTFMENSFQGFQTASGKAVTISEDSLLKAKARMLELEKEGSGHEKNSSKTECKESNFQGFQTASGKAVTISEDALLKAKARMLELETEGSGHEKNSSKAECKENTYHGFQTASGKAVTVSEDALLKAKARLMELDKESSGLATNSSKTEFMENSFQGFQTASGKAVTVSENALLKAKARMLELETEGSVHANNSSNAEFKENTCHGFQTTSGKAVTVSEDALLKAKARMVELETKGSGHEKNSSKAEFEENTFRGFQTASGKAVTVSEDALLKAKARLTELDKESSGLATNSSKTEFMENSFQGFQTASGKAVTVSEDALLKARARLMELDKESSGLATNSSKTEFIENSFQGFQTASGKAVTVSENALLKAKARMLELEKEGDVQTLKSSATGNEENGFHGFQTGSGRAVTISEDSLLSAKTRMLQLEKGSSGHATNSPKTEFKRNSFQGFQTASGKAVKVSEDALLRAKATMIELEKEAVGQILTSSATKNEENSFQGFQESPVAVSDQALLEEKSRVLDNKNFVIEKKKDSYQVPEIAQGLSCKRKDCRLRKVAVKEFNSYADNSEKERSSMQLVPSAIDPLLLTDDEVSREVLESSKALLADEPFLDLGELLVSNSDRFTEITSGTNTSVVREGVNSAERQPGTRLNSRKGNQVFFWYKK